MSKKTKHNNIPPLRFDGFSDEWQEKKLGTCVTIERGERVVKNELLENGVYPVISGGISPLGFLDVFNRNANTITISQYGTAGFVSLQNQKFWANDVCYSLYPQGISTDFLYSFLKGKQEYIYSLNTTAVPAHLPQERLESMQLSHPSFEEQEQIGNFFRALDELIGAKEEELEKLRQMKAALLEAMFPNNENKNNVNRGGYKCINVNTLSKDLYLSEGSATTPRLRFRGFTEPWQKKKLGEVAEVVMCKRILKYQTTKQGDVPFFKIGTFGSTPDAYISYALFNELKEKFHYPQKGDLLISAAGTIGRIVEFTGEDQYFQDSNIVWLKFNNPIDNQYLKAIYSIIKWQGLEGSTLKRLYNNNILRTEISLPSLAEQERIGEFFRGQDEGIAAVGDQIERLKAMKQACLDRMFA